MVASVHPTLTHMLTEQQITHFQLNGFLVLPQLASTNYCAEVLAFAQQQLAAAIPPLELEAETGYPGAPAHRDAIGGETVRRLLQVATRSSLLLDWAIGPTLTTPLKQLLGHHILLSQAHHNCIMTKQPQFSSLTGWHRDSRYWSFERPELISAWLALRDETIENGCLLVIPGSHLMQINSTSLDALQFLRIDDADNQTLLKRAIAVPLKAGDVLLFSSNLFHAAGRNLTEQTKFSMVFTYRALDNPPLADTRSASLAEIAVP